MITALKNLININNKKSTEAFLMLKILSILNK